MSMISCEYPANILEKRNTFPERYARFLRREQYPNLCARDKHAIERCLVRVKRWRVPPNWSRAQWLEEAEAHATFAAITEKEKDASSYEAGIENNRHESRIQNSLLKRYRQEWLFVRHCGGNGPDELLKFNDLENVPESVLQCLRTALQRLSESDQRLIRMLYWEHCTQSQMAASLGISQQAISKRNRLILRRLFRILKKEYFTFYRL